MTALGNEEPSNQVIRFIQRPKGGDLYTVQTTPAGSQPSIVVLFCQPTFEEHGRAYPVIRECARWLCARGIGALRFDYFGAGESSGESQEFSMSSAMEDISFLSSRLMEEFPCAKIVPLGVRLGCRFMLEALASRIGEQDRRLATPILWDPVLDAREYVLSGLRATIASAMVVYETSVATREEIIRETQEKGVCQRGDFQLNQIDGFPITHTLLRDIDMSGVEPWTFQNPVSVIVTTPSGDGKRQRKELGPLLPRMEFYLVRELQYWDQPPLYSQIREQLFKTTQECIEQCA